MTVYVNENERDIFEKAINTFGIKNQEDIAIEEMSELTKAIIKHRRYNTEETKENILEEMADVLIMVLQMATHYGLPNKYYNGKLIRLEQMLEPPVFKVTKPVYKVTDRATGKTTRQSPIIKGVTKDA